MDLSDRIARAKARVKALGHRPISDEEAKRWSESQKKTNRETPGLIEHRRETLDEARRFRARPGRHTTRYKSDRPKAG